MSASYPHISVIIIFFNMRREAPRTLYSLTRGYQRGSEGIQYEVIAIDNGSTEPLSWEEVKSFGPEFRYHYFETRSCSPADAVNCGAEMAKGDFLTICIDGARILSPGILASINRMVTAYAAPFIYTLGFHLGPDIQNNSILKGYNQQVEDELLANSGWENDGYKLFNIASLAGSSIEGYLGPLAESNCFCIPKREFVKLGGFNPLFQTPGGGLVNLEFFQRACKLSGMTPVMLLGEGTFHQIHGGVATNVSMLEHPMESYQEEYRRIYNNRWEIEICSTGFLWAALSCCQKLSGKGHQAGVLLLCIDPGDAPLRYVGIIKLHGRFGVFPAVRFLTTTSAGQPAGLLGGRRRCTAE
jgi:hypothetical protein